MVGARKTSSQDAHLAPGAKCSSNTTNLLREDAGQFGVSRSPEGDVAERNRMERKSSTTQSAPSHVSRPRSRKSPMASVAPRSLCS